MKNVPNSAVIEARRCLILYRNVSTMEITFYNVGMHRRANILVLSYRKLASGKMRNEGWGAINKRAQCTLHNVHSTSSIAL